MSKRRPIQLAIAMTALSPIFYTSCVDNDYDLSKDIDMTVSVGGNNLALPACSTDTISLRKIFDLDEGNALKVNRGEIAGLAWGDYYLNENDGEPTTSTLTADLTSLNLGTTQENKEKLIFANPALAGITEDLKTLVDLNTDFKLHNEEVPGQLRQLNRVEMEAPITIRVSFDSPDGIEKLSMKEGLVIELEEYMELENREEDFYRIEGNKITITKDTPINKYGKTITAVLKKVDLEKWNMMHLFTPSADSKNENLYGTIDLPANVKVLGDMALSVSDFPGDKLTATAEFAAKIEISNAEILTVKGKIAPNFDVNFDPVDFTDIPEFLNDEETNIDLYDPRIYISVENTAPVGLNIEADMVGLDEKGNIITVNGQEAQIHVGKQDYNAPNALYMRENTNAVYALSVRAHSYGPDTICIQVPDLNRLINKIPSKIDICNITPTVPDKEYTVKMNTNYDIKTQYQIISPLAFGENLNFVYKDTLDGWGEDLEDFQLKEQTTVEVEIETENTIPMGMQLEAKPLYKDDINRNNVNVEVTGNIEAGNGDINHPSHSSIKVVLSSTDGSLEQLDGITLHVKGKSNSVIAGVPLNEHQSLKIKSAVVRIKGGVIIDLN